MERVLGPHSGQRHEVARRLREGALARRGEQDQRGDHEAVAEVLPQRQGVQMRGLGAQRIRGIWSVL